MWRKRLIQLNCIMINIDRIKNWFLSRVGILSTKIAFFLDKLGSRTKESVFSFYIKNENFFFFFGYLTFFFLSLFPIQKSFPL